MTITGEKERSKALRSLQCARGIAALLVVYFHASSIADPNLTGNWSRISWDQRWLSLSTHLPVFGQCGVDLFFVISGYIIWTSTLPTMETLTFYKRRLARIVPLYWLMTLAAALLLLSAPSAVNTMRLAGPHLVASLLFVPWPNPAFPPGSPGECTPLIVAGWTLNFEMMFYLLFGLVAPRGRRRLRLMAWVFGIVVVVAVLAGRWFPNLRFYDPFLVGEFMLGCLLAAMGDKLRCSATFAAVLLCISFVGLLMLDTAEPPVSRFFSLGLPATLVVFSLIQLERRGRLPPTPILGRIGDASYSIYLTHIVALALLRMAWRPLASGLALKSVQTAFCVSVVALAITIGLLCFSLVERPITRLAEHVLGVGRRTGAPCSSSESGVLPNAGFALRIP